MPGTDRVVRRAPWFLWALPSLIALNALRYPRWLLVAGPVALVALALAARMRTVLAPDGITWNDGMRGGHVRWADVVSIGPERNGVAVVTVEGRTIGLPLVVWRPVMPEEYVSKGSAQHVAMYARAHGYDVAIRAGD